MSDALRQAPSSYVDGRFIPIPGAELVSRNPANTDGDPIGYTLSIPPAFVLSGLPLTFRWFAFNASGAEISQAYPIKVFL